MERPHSPVVVDGEEEFEVEALLRHKGLRCLASLSGVIKRLSHHQG